MKTRARAASATATWAYCLVESSAPPRLGREGVPRSGPLRSIPAGPSLHLVACSVPLASFGQKPIERGLHDLAWVSRCAIAHEGVIDRCLPARAVLPFKLFTIFADDASALDHVHRQRASIAKALRRVRDRLEWSVRVEVEERPVARARPASGTSFLRGKVAARAARRGARAEAEKLLRDLGRKADDHGRRAGLEDLCLVRRARRAAFEKAAAAGARRLARAGVSVVLSGPWAPYHFVGAR